MWHAMFERLRRKAKTDSAGASTTSFLGYRAAALESVTALRAHPRNPAEEQLARFLLDSLTNVNIPSFVLPVNGLFIERNTPISLNLQHASLPHGPFFLEYAISSDWYKEELPPGNWRAYGSVLLVDPEPVPAKLNLWGVWKQEWAGEICWRHAEAGMRLSADSQIKVYGTGHGRVSVSNSDILTLPNSKSTSENAEQLGLAYIDDLHILAQFLTVFAADNIVPEKLPAPRQAPGRYYALRCRGPTPFRWLPGSGMM